MKILIIGYGTMGQAIAKAVKQASGKFEVLIYKKGMKLPSSLDFAVIAVKPQGIVDLSQEMANTLPPKTILVSIAAGVPIKRISVLFAHSKIIRMMPNLALAVGQGIAGWKSSWKVTAAEQKKINQFFSAFTEHFPVKQEKALDAITAISGSGPAYFFYLAAGIEKSARKLGFSPKEARALVEKTFLGAAFLQKGQDYEGLISKVASKKGTTEAAIKSFNNKNTHKIIDEAVKAAFKRAQELSHE